MISEDEAGHQVSYWPSVSDLFMTLFVIAIAMVAVVLFVFVVNPGQDLIEGAVEKLGEAMGLPPSIKAMPPGPDREKAILDIIREATKTIEACKDLRENSNELVQCREQKVQLTQDLAQIQERLSKAEEALSLAEEDRERLTAELAAAREQSAILSDWLLKTLTIIAQLREVLDRVSGPEPLNDEPPIITIGSDLLFRSGSADIGGATALLQEGPFEGIAAEIQRRNINGKMAVNTLEIIGHTDSVPIAGRQKGNLDAGMPDYRDGRLALRAMKPGSNNDLGLLRALAIKQAWLAFVAKHPARTQLEDIAVRTYSAGQTEPVNREIRDDPQSRRIELRLTKLRP